MATKKDFTAVNMGYRVSADIDHATGERRSVAAASPEEAAERAAEMKTQGRKGCKATRINMAFTPANHDFIKTMSRVCGYTMTEFTNIVIERYRMEHPEIYEQAKGIAGKL